MHKQKDVMAKMLKSMLDMIVLKMLLEKPMHGYAFISAIRKRFGVYFGPSTIYPLLNNLEMEGYVESEWDVNASKPHKTYKITPKGKELLEETEKGLRIIVQPLLAASMQQK